VSRWMILLTVSVSCAVAQGDLQRAWQFTAEGDISPGMVVADMHPSPGQEILFLDTGTGSVVCLDGEGAVLWVYDGAFFEATAPPAFTALAPDRRGLVLVQDDDLAVIALDSASGDEVWRFDETPLPNARLAWTDLNDDGRAEALILSPGHGLIALDGEGRLEWEVRVDDLRGDGDLVPVIAAGDVLEDFFADVAGARGDHVFLLDNMGFPKWEEGVSGTVVAGPVLVAPSEHGPGGVVVGTKGPDALVLLTPDTGATRWEAPLGAAPHGEGLAITLLWPGGPAGVAVLLADGHSVLFDLDGKQLWQGGRTGVSLGPLLAGDLEGDGWPALLSVDGGGALHFLQEGRTAPSAYAEGQAHGVLGLLGAAGQGALLVSQGSEIVAYTVGAGSHPELFPWAMVGGTASRNHYYRMPESLDDIQWVETHISLPLPALTDGDEMASGWEEGVGEGRAVASDGGLALHSESEETAFSVQSGLIALPSFAVELRLQGSIGEGAEAGALTVLWEGPEGPYGEEVSGPASGMALPIPYGATHLRVGLSVAGSCQWTRLEGSVLTRTLPQAGIFHNRLGFETNGTKHFTAWTNFLAQSYRFALIDSSGNVAHESSLAYGQRMEGPYGEDWGAYYWRGDFSDFLAVGEFQLEVNFDGKIARSAPFSIDHDLLWKESFGLVLESFAQHRCGEETGQHCVEAEGAPAGAWRKGSSPETLETVETVFRLAEAFVIAQWRYTDGGELTDFGRQFRRQVDHGVTVLLEEADYYLGQAPETVEAYGAALARAARMGEEGDNEKVLAAATSHAQAIFEAEAPGPLAYSVAMDLFILTRDPLYSEWVKKLYPGANHACVESVVEYEIQIDEMSLSSMALMNFLNAASDKLLARADNPFGVFMAEAGNTPNVFGTPMDGDMPEGNSAAILAAARIVAQAARFQPRASYRAFVYDQLNWLWGNNPFGQVLIRGAEADFGWYREGEDGAWEGTPGIIARGIGGTAPGDDRPFFDFSTTGTPEARSNGYDLETSLNYLSTVAHLKRVRR